MAFFDLNKIKEGVESGAKKAQEGLAAGIKSAQEGLSSIKVDEVVEGAKGAVTSGVSAIGGVIDGIVPKEATKEEGTSSYHEFVSILWYLIHVDGSVTLEERETFNQIVSSIDDGFSAYADELEEECSAALQISAAEFGPSVASKIEAQKVIESIDFSSTDAKLMCWNLLALANADGVDKNEFDFIRFVSEKAGVSQSVFEELRNYCDAVVEIGKASERLKASNRSYSEIEPLVSEFEERERVVIEAAQALVSDR